jgi:hypothetical protein
MRIEAKRCAGRKPDGATIAAGAACLFAVHLTCAIAAAQTPNLQAPPPAPSIAPAPAPPSPTPQGFFDTFGNWVQQGVANVGAGFGAMVGAVGGQASQAAKGAPDAASTAAKGAADVARDTAASVTKLPVAGRERCILAPNGAPDCRVAAEALCRAKGYDGGTSVDFETTEKCPPPYRVSSRNTPEGVCTMEHFVTRAWCQ